MYRGHFLRANIQCFIDILWLRLKNSAYLCKKKFFNAKLTSVEFMKFLYRSALAYILFSLCACSSTSSDSSGKPIIAVSIEPQRQIVESIAGDEYEVVAVLSRGANPETFDPSMSQRVATAQSVAYLSIGAFPFEKNIAGTLAESQVHYDCSDGVEKIYGTHDHHHSDEDNHNGSPDPHVWSSTRNAKIIASNIAKALSDIKPDNKNKYYAKLDSLCQHIDMLDKSIASKLTQAGCKAFAIWHPSLSYFAKDYNLHQVSVGQESKEVSPRKLHEIIEKATADSVKVFFFQKEFDSRQAASINEKIGSRLVVIDPLAYDWMSELIHIADELSTK